MVKTKPFRVFSTFTGIGGFEIGIENAAAGRPIEIVGYSEIDKYATSVYEHHFKGVRNYGDITKIDEKTLPDFDCLVGGFPCQAFSVAGKRAGFDDTRGTLFFDLARILRTKRPRLFVFENVKGLLNHDGGNTFRTIITTIVELGYDCQWEVLNSKNHGVPQNRERVIIVGHLRGSSRPQVFPITRENGNIANASQHEQQRPQSRFIKTRHLSQNGRLVSESTTLQASEIPHIVEVGTLRTHKDGEGFRATKSGLAPTIPARARNDGSGQPVVKILTGSPKYVDGKRTMAYKVSDDAPTIRATQHKSGDNQPRVLIREATKKGYAEATVGQAINLNQPNSKTRRGRVSDIAPTLDTHPEIYTVQDTKTAYALTATDYKRTGSEFVNKHKGNFGIIDGVIRRLTPVECERLQAFPDNWTATGIDAKTGEPYAVSDSQRYKMCGNAVTTNVIQTVFEQIFRTY